MKYEKGLNILNLTSFETRCLRGDLLTRVLSDRENRENREKSGNLVGREKSGKSQGICCLDREKIIKAFYSSNRYPVYLTYDVILCSCCIYVIVHISFHLF
jgi:hypothetical protein